MIAEVDIIPPGNYEVVIAAAEDAETRGGWYMRRLTMVVVSPGSPYVGAVLWSWAVEKVEASFVWEDAVDQPADFDVRQRYIVAVAQDTMPDRGLRMRVHKILSRPGDDRAPHREPVRPSEPAREPTGRRSAVEEARERIESTVEQFLMETAEPLPATEPQPYADRRGAHGVAMPDRDLAAGQILSAEFARKFGAQLIRAADLHDALLDAGRDDS
jgi:hypothetical protein